MSGRPRLEIGTFGDIAVSTLAPQRVRACTRYRDWDGRTRQVTATGCSASAAKAALKSKLAQRQRAGDYADRLSPDSSFTDLADAWLEELRRDPERSEGTKEVYERELRTLILPMLKHYTVREVTVSRVERFLKEQREKSYARAKHSKTLLSLVMGFAVRAEVVPRNPVKETSRLRKPKKLPKALTAEQIGAIRTAAREWRTGPGVLGPRPDGQVRDLIEVMLGSATRIGEALGLRKCDVDVTANPPTIHVCGTIVVRKGVGVIRQPVPKTNESNRVVAIAPFAAAVLRLLLARIEDEDEDHLLFFTRKGTPLAPHNARRTFREILKLAGLAGLDISPHSFRRTGATRLNNKAGIDLAADVLGHTTTRTTEEFYTETARRANPVSAEILQGLAPRRIAAFRREPDQHPAPATELHPNSR